LEIHRMVLCAAGELRVMSELMLRGFNPAKTYLDNGIDLILENGKTIQVKTSMGNIFKSNREKPTMKYSFAFQDWQNNKRIKADFVICWAVGEDSFFIIPSQKIKAASLIYAPQWKKNRMLENLNAWQILR